MKASSHGFMKFHSCLFVISTNRTSTRKLQRLEVYRRLRQVGSSASNSKQHISSRRKRPNQLEARREVRSYASQNACQISKYSPQRRLSIFSGLQFCPQGIVSEMLFRFIAVARHFDSTTVRLVDTPDSSVPDQTKKMQETSPFQLKAMFPLT